MLVALGIIPAAVIVAGLALALAAVAYGRSDLFTSTTGDEFERWLGGFVHTPEGFLWATLPGQFVFLGSALICGRLSPQPMRQRLGLRESRLGVAAYVLFPLATPTLAVITGLLLGPLVEHEGSEQLRELERMITGPSGWHALLVISLVSLLPGFAEELVFRGYIQQRLTAAWGALPAILFAGVLFAAAHMDLTHSVLVFPLGLWLGLVAWRTGTVWVAILCHAYYNLFQCLLARSGWAEQAARTAFSANVEMDPAPMAVFAVTMLAFAAALGVLMWDAVKARKSPPPEA
jgi:membrane protease YdiL (CAAX protease family)